MFGAELLKDYLNEIQRLYAERTGGNAAAQPRLLTSGSERPPQSAYEDALARLNAANGTDLTKPVTAYDAPPSVIALPETLEATVLPAPAPEAKLSVADIYKEAYNELKTTPPKRYPTPKLWGTFPPYNKSFSEANELAIRWAHREDIEVGDQRPISYHGKWYLVEKFDSADLGYQIVDQLNEIEIAEYEKRAKDASKGQSIQQGFSEFDRLY